MSLVTVLLLLLLASISGYAEDWSLHFQATAVNQIHGNFNSPYSGSNSLVGYEEDRTSLTSTLFLSRALWQGAAFSIDPEISAGTGLSSTHGVADFPNGEIYRVDTPDPKVSISRIFVQHVFELDGDKEDIPDDKNQVKTRSAINRITAIFGKFSLNDYFDNNTYSHDPRTQFLNWGFMDLVAWDYAADTRGYTWGFYLEFKTATWVVRAASALMPDQANEMGLDMNVNQAHGDNLEFEWRHHLFESLGKIRVLYYNNHAHMGNYRLSLLSPGTPNITLTRDYRSKVGLGLNIEQEISKFVGLFSRLGWNDGQNESYVFTEADSTFSLGTSLKGELWGRNLDTIGVGAIISGLSSDHAAYLTAGGYGFILGDSFLTYSPEEIIETYYLFKPCLVLGLTADYQFVNNPGYNADRGPVSIFSGRIHYEF